MIRYRLALVVGLLLGGVAASEAGGNWLTDFEEAKKQAKEQGVPILADFTGSDWCGWCIKLKKEVFSQEAFQAYAKDNLVLLELDFPRRKEIPAETRKQNEALMKEFGIRGFPTILLLDAEGKELDRTGYRRGGAEKYVAHLKELLEAEQE